MRAPGAPRAVLFDLDDTLLDYSGHTELCWVESCAAVALPPGVEAATLVGRVREVGRRFWSDPVRHRRERTDMLGAWRKIAEEALAGCGVAAGGLAGAIAEDFARRRRQRWTLFPDARRALERLRGDGLPLGLLTNGDARMQRDKIADHDLGHFFDVIVIEGEFGAGKPDEVVYRHALDTLGVSAGAVWMIGDNLEWDVAGAQRVGARGAWIDRAGRGLPAGAPARPDGIVRSLDELARLLDPAAPPRGDAPAPVGPVAR
jgi:putative hydrolase of the HAD superfamily